MSEFPNRFEGVDLGSSATLRRQVQSSVRRRHEDFADVIQHLRRHGHWSAAAEIERMIDQERKEVGL